MFYVLFSAVVKPEHAKKGEQYYTKLQPILNKTAGFIEEIPFSDPSNPSGQLLFANFEDAASIMRWRSNKTHLRIMHHARHQIFEQFRVTVGSDEAPIGDREGRVVVVYTRQESPRDLKEDSKELSTIVSADASSIEDEMEFYVGESQWMWVARLRAGRKAKDFEDLLRRVPNDAVTRMYVTREYTQNDRREAPTGIDAAEKKASALD